MGRAPLYALEVRTPHHPADINEPYRHSARTFICGSEKLLLGALWQIDGGKLKDKAKELLDDAGIDTFERID